MNNEEQEPLQAVVMPAQQQNIEPVVIVPLEPHQPPEQVHLVEHRPHGMRQQIIIQQAQQPLDDPTCLYAASCFSIFIPIIGLLVMCCYSCGSNLGPRQRQGFIILVISTIIGFLINIIVGIVGSDTPNASYSN